MKISLKQLAVGLCLGAFTLTACQGSKNNSDSKDPIKITSQSDADQLVAAGEQLMSPYTFMLANKVFEIALTAAPNNKKAQFFHNFLKHWMTYKGFLTRIRPFAREYGDIKSLEATIQNIPYSPLRDFLTDGKEDIKNYEDMQTWLVSFRNALNEFRLFLRDNPDLDLVLNLNPDVFRLGASSTSRENCRIVPTKQSANPNPPQVGLPISVGSKKYEVLDGKSFVNDQNDAYEVQCDYREILQRKFNPADALALRQAVGGYILFFTAYTSYSIAGLENVLKKYPEQSLPKGAAMQVELENLPEFAKLRKDNNMRDFLRIGSDIVPSVRWAIAHQNELCPNGISRYPNQRPGHVFSSICISNPTETEKTLALLEQTLKGVIRTELDIPNTNEKAVTNVDYFAWSRNPVEDLRSVAPSSYNACGKAKTLRDKTAGGVFPLGDAELFLPDRACDVR